MPASGILVDAVNAVKTQLTALSLVPITDPRNARPMSVLIELPTVTAFTYNVGNIDIRLRVLAPPPGNQDAGDYLMTIADQIMNSPIAVTDLRPGLVSIGGQDLPSYDLTVAVAVRRN
ncbi:hypothetical protein UFOVP335_3 [uncultured Caudovirales phage]|jgi:hypothetical protein|uniref:Uncharacterized protein n=1 Tax=uncultured Caudovirales phage TaxID=2100421 RepID=A0A6J5M468_9CAUD|nr:hypothetical protein UFOVP335_3 [uncultured Caudovirales phage]